MGLANQHKKGRLKSVVGIIEIAQDTPADGHDHRAVERSRPLPRLLLLRLVFQQTRRPVGDIIGEIESQKREKKLFFFVDDNITSNMEQAKEFFRALNRIGYQGPLSIEFLVPAFR